MEQNTDRMWWTIGVVVLGGALIVGAMALIDSNLLPAVGDKLTDLFGTVNIPTTPAPPVNVQ